MSGLPVSITIHGSQQSHLDLIMLYHRIKHLIRLFFDDSFQLFYYISFNPRDRVYRSEMIPHHVNPVWDEAKIHLHTICNNDFKRPIRLQVFDLKKNGTRKSMGSFETNLEHFLAAKSLRGNADPTNAFTLYKDELDVGKLVVVNAGISEDSEKITEEKNGLNQVPSKPGFVDYLYGGCEVNLTVAIDFSSNNGKLENNP